MRAEPSKSRSPVRVLIGLIVLLVTFMGAALFVAFGPEGDVDGNAGAATAAETAGPAESGPEHAATSGRRTTHTGGGAAANVAATLRGRLRAYRTREPVAGVSLTLTVPPATAGGEALAVVAQSDEAGAFRFEGLPPRAGCELAGRHEPFAPVALAGLDLEPAATLDLGTIWLDVPVDLPVDVLAMDGSPIDGAEVAVFATTGGAATASGDEPAGIAGVGATPTPTATATTGEDGAATVTGLLPGTYHVRAAAAGRGVGFRDGVIVAPDARRTRVLLLLPAAHTLRGVVLDADEAPVAEARVIAAPQQSGRKSMDKVECTTTPEGRYELSGLAPGVHTLFLARADKPLVLAGTARIPEMTRLDIRLRPTATLLGSVRDQDGAPIADAEVSYAPQGGVALSTRTAEDGSYRLEDVPSGPSQYFRVRKDGFVPFPDPTAPQQGTGEALREGAEIRRDVVLESGVAVTVTVLAKDGDAPIEAARVELRMAQMWGGGGKPWTATSGESGVAAFPGIVPGTYLVVITAPGWVQPGFPPQPQALVQSPQAMPEAWRLEVSAATTATFRLERGGTVSGRVLDGDGSPFAGARVAVAGARSQIPVFSADDGSFTVDAVPARRRAVATATAEGTPTATSKPFSIAPGEAVEDVEIELVAGGRVTGRVRAGDGRPLTGAYVRYVRGQLNARNPWAFRQFDNAQRYPVTADGTFEIPGVDDGQITVRADAAGYLPGWDASVKVADGQDVGGIDIIVKPATEVSGRVETPSGAPVPGATVNANYTGTSQQRQWGFVAALPGPPQAQTDAEGRFTLRGLAPGNYNLWANAPGHAAGGAQNAATGAGEVLITLGRAERIAGVVEGPGGTGLGGVPVQARNADNSRSGRNWWFGGGAQVFTAPDGSFEIPDLAEGIYDLTVSANWVWGRDVNVKETTKQGVRTGTTDVEILVQAGATIEGRVIDEEGAAVTSGWVSATNESGGGSRGPWGGNQRWARLGSDGAFRISGLEPGAHTIQAFGTFQSDPARGVASGTTDVELEVRGGGTIEGWLVDGQGLSIATGFNVQIRKKGVEAWGWAQTYQPGDGAFVLVGLEDTAYDLKFQVSPYAPVELSNVVVGTSDLEVLLQMGQEISGTVVGADGNPIAANVQAIQINVAAGGTATNGWGRAQGDGAFTIVGLVNGEYRLFVRAGNHAPAIVEPVRGGAAGLRIALEEGVSITGTVKYEDDAPVMNARLQLQSDDGLSVAWARSAQDGTFTFQHVPSSGSYAITGNVWGGGQNVTIRHEDKVQPGATDVAVVVK